MKVVCKQCGREFEAKRSDAKFCSSTCRSKAKRAKKVVKPIICGSCGRKFVPTHGAQIYCSDYCKQYEASERDRLTKMYNRTSYDAWQDGDADDYDDGAMDYDDC